MSYLSALVELRCPKCRKGKMFKHKPYSFKGISAINTTCPHCKIPYRLEPSFFYGSMYVSYALGVALAVAVYVLLFLVGVGKHLVMSFLLISAAIIILSPYIYQLSKVIWASFFIKYDPTKSLGK